ncbi:MAG: DNA repair protein RecO [Pedosphaera sp.]|nr:DNA repair protein RecO [Pedosphaera sp.]
MIESTHGIILRTRLLTETSLIVNWLTPDLGRVSTVAKGARRPKSPFAGKLDIFYEAEFSFTRSRRSDLHALREVNLRQPNTALRQELGRLQQVAYCAALIVQTTEVETPLREVHALFSGLLKHVTQQPPKPRNIFAFELKLLRALGLEPDAEESKFPAETRTLVTTLTESSWEKLGDLRATAAQARALQQYLHGFLIYQFGKLATGRHAALGESG